MTAGSVRLPIGGRLAEIAVVLARVRLAAELFDPEWNLVWISDELKTLLGEQDEAALGYGAHVLEARNNELWTRAATPESRTEWGRANLPYVLAETPPETLERVAAELGITEGDPRVPEEIEPAPAPPTWSYELVYRRPGFQPMRISCIALSLHDPTGERLGSANVYAPALPSSMIDLLARGDERMFERMARLVEPGPRPAAILFADLQSSGTLSRKLSSATYFRLIRALTTAVDDVVGEFGGIVGKHAGDGVTAFVLSEDAGSQSGAARAAVDAAAGIATASGLVAAEFGSEAVAVTADDVRMNVGLHWGGALYVGQIVTGGRLEVTALGDEVTECARIQQSMRDGGAYASKALLEQLEPDDATAAGVDPDAAVYRTVADLPGADEKAVRDAGGIAVAELLLGR